MSCSIIFVTLKTLYKPIPAMAKPPSVRIKPSCLKGLLIPNPFEPKSYAISTSPSFGFVSKRQPILNNSFDKLT